MELCAFRKHGMRALYCICSSHECTLHAAAKLQHSSHYTCHIKIFRFIGTILSIAGMGQDFFMPSSIMPPLILPSRQTHLGHGDMVHSLTPIGLSMPSPPEWFYTSIMAKEPVPICDLAWENWACVHRIHLFILWYISPLWLRNLKICKLHEIPYEMLHK